MFVHEEDKSNNYILHTKILIKSYHRYFQTNENDGSENRTN